MNRGNGHVKPCAAMEVNNGWQRAYRADKAAEQAKQRERKGWHGGATRKGKS